MEENGLTPKLLEVSQMLASGLTYSQISEAVGIPRSTIGRWAKLEAVRAQVGLLRSEALQAHVEFNREVAVISAETINEKLDQAAKRQEEFILRGYSVGAKAVELAERMLVKISEIFSENRPIEQHEKLLISSFPHVMRAASDMLRATSDCEDKIFALEEMNRRLDEWQKFQQEFKNNQN